MISIISYILMFSVSVFMAFAAAKFRNEYISEKKCGIKELVSAETKTIAVFGAVFLAASAAGTLLVYKDIFAEIKAPQYLVLWEGVCIAGFIDLKVKKIPNRLLVILFAARTAGIAAELIFSEATVYETILFSLIGGAAGGLIILICMFISKGGVGAGDVKLYALTGFYFGFAGLINVMFYSLFTAAFAGIVLLVTKKAKRKSQLAMAPFVFIGINLYLLLS